MADNEEKKDQKKSPPKELMRINPNHFGAAKSLVRQYSCTVPAGMGKAELVKSEMWDHIAAKLQLFDEVRCIAEDGAWLAHIIVTFKAGNKVLVQPIHFTQLEVISYEEQSGLNRFEVKQRGMKKWCIMDTKDGSVVYEEIPTQAEAHRKLEEHISIINR